MQRALVFLGELESRDIEMFLQLGHKMEIPKDTVLIRQGRDIKALYILLQGQLSVAISPPEEACEIARLSEGDIVGELSFLDKRPPSATVTARTHCVLLAIPRHTLEAKIQTETDFAARFYRAVGVLLASRLRKTVSSLGYSQNPVPIPEEEPGLSSEEMDGSMVLAGDWFDYIMKKLLGSPAI